MSHCSPEINVVNNVVLVATEVQMSASREAQLTPTSLQEVTHMSKCIIDRLVSVVLIVGYCIAHLIIGSVLSKLDANSWTEKGSAQKVFF